ncbi:MAG: ABC transporter substrate-binding protein [Firmicutes bacterium]|nr:ABC transporter substrate-binding protein [Bacillota bacterium]HPU01158.1 ABC transporter substrate-binding protein [Bacillota bacterium]
MKKVWLWLLVGVLGLSFLAAAGCGPEEGMIKIGIVQIADHPALNDARDGFIEALKEEGFEDGKNINIDIQNAQGDITTASTIAEGFVADGVDLILAIATQAAEAAYKATKDIPIVITAVTDPVAIGLADSLEHPGKNVTGTHDMNPIKEQLELLKEILPDATTVGVIFNSGEENSRVQVEILEKVAGDFGMTIVKAAVTSTGEVSTATESLIGKVDAIYIPTDNTVVSAIASVIQVSDEHKIPVIPGEESCVRAGALATLGIDYFRLGHQAGKMAAKILRGEAEPSTMPIEGQTQYRVVVNKAAAEKLNVTLPASLLERADEVIE